MAKDINGLKVQKLGGEKKNVSFVKVLKSSATRLLVRQALRLREKHFNLEAMKVYLLYC